MNPEGHLGDNFPLQAGRHDGFPGQAGGHTRVQYTAVNISTEPPQDYIIWSLCNFVYTNPFCLGLAALIYSIKARDRKMVGDLQGAQHYGKTARCLNIWATVLIATAVLISIITVIIIAVQVQQAYHYRYNYRW
ncbi:dispanin subfamily A member 2b-like [Mastacembelus armatus]|uniref:Dispanin subfamily A member 2b-like n=1 Tax=Mastacembelus armatus TaxID=205130 RepID=A0A7N9ATA7_9TELE|nr:dispanin subfamily A member 2b-like [Mastacembelus armatus]